MYEFNPRFGFGWPTDRVNPLDSGTGWCSDVTRRVTNGYDQDIKESPRFGKPGAPIGLDSVVFRCDTRCCTALGRQLFASALALD